MAEMGALTVDGSPVPKAATVLFMVVFGSHLGHLEGLIRGGPNSSHAYSIYVYRILERVRDGDIILDELQIAS